MKLTDTLIKRYWRGVTTAAENQFLVKSGVIPDILAMAKSQIGPGQLNPGGALRPQASEKMISLVFDDDFLKKVTTRRMKRLTADGNVFDIPSRSMRHVPQGTEPTAADKTNTNEFGYELSAKETELYVDITLDFLRDNADNTNIVTELEAAFAMKLRGELVDLAFNGDEADADPFIKLNDGWVKIAQDAANLPKVQIDPATDGWVDTFAAVLEQLPSHFRGGAAFIVNTADRDRYALEIGKHVSGTNFIETGKAGSLIQYPLVTSHFVPEGHVMLTNPKNLVFGLNTQMDRFKEFDARKRVWEYTWTVHSDFEIAAKQACVLGHP